MTPESDPPVACSLTPDQLAARRGALLPGLLQRAVEVSDLPNGLRLRFDAAPRLLVEIATVMEQERACCRFLRFALKAEPAEGPVILEVTGPEGTAAMLRGL